MNEMMPVLRDTQGSVHDQIQALLPEIAARADEIEENAAVPLDLLAKIEKAGGFRLVVPTAFGGAELSLRETCEIIQMVAAVDASVAWTIAVTIGTQILTARLPYPSLAEFYSAGPSTWSKGAYTPKAVAVPVEGGYRVSGRWPLASGARNFDWVSLGFTVQEGKGIRMMPDGKRPDIRVCLVPKGPIRVIKTWQATGLRGTRSDDLEVEDLFVPEAWQGPFFGPSNLDSAVIRAATPSATAPLHSAVMLGMLEGAINDLATGALTRRPASNPKVLMKDDPVFQAHFGELISRVNALCALNQTSIADISRIAGERRSPTAVEEGAIGSDCAFINHSSTKIMDDIMMLAGSGAVYDSNILQRRWRDLRCAAQHQSANLGNYGRYGAAFVDDVAARATA